MKSLKFLRLSQLNSGTEITIIYGKGKPFTGRVLSNDHMKSLELKNDYGEIFITDYKHIKSFIISSSKISYEEKVFENEENINIADEEEIKPEIIEEILKVEEPKIVKEEVIPGISKKIQKFFENTDYIVAPEISENYLTNLFSVISDKKAANTYFASFMHGLKNNDLSKCATASAQFEEAMNDYCDDETVIKLLANMYAYAEKFEDAAAIFSANHNYHSAAVYAYLAGNCKGALDNVYNFFINTSAEKSDIVNQMAYILVNSVIHKDDSCVFTDVSDKLVKLLKNSAVTAEDCADYLIFKKGLTAEAHNFTEKCEIIKSNYVKIREPEKFSISKFPDNVIFGSVYAKNKMTYTVREYDSYMSLYNFEKASASATLFEKLSDDEVNITDINVYFMSADGKNAFDVKLLSASAEDMIILGNEYLHCKKYKQAISCYFFVLKYDKDNESVINSIVNSYMALAKVEGNECYYNVIKKFLDKYGSAIDNATLNKFYFEAYSKLGKGEYKNVIKYLDLLIYGDVNEEKRKHFSNEKMNYLFKNNKYEECLETIKSLNIQSARAIEVAEKCEQALKEAVPEETVPVPEKIVNESISVDTTEAVKPEIKEKSKAVKKKKTEEPPVIEKVKTYIMPSNMDIADEYKTYEYTIENADIEYDERSFSNSIKRFFMITNKDTGRFLRILMCLVTNNFFSLNFLRKINKKIFSDISVIEYILNSLYDLGLVSRIHPAFENDEEQNYYSLNENGKKYFRSEAFRKIIKQNKDLMICEDKGEFTDNIYISSKVEKALLEIFSDVFSNHECVIVKECLKHMVLYNYSLRSEKVNKSSYMDIIVLVPLKFTETSEEDFTADIHSIEKVVKFSMGSALRTRILICSNCGYQWLTIIKDAFENVIDERYIVSVSDETICLNSNFEEITPQQVCELFISTSLPDPEPENSTSQADDEETADEVLSDENTEQEVVEEDIITAEPEEPAEEFSYYKENTDIDETEEDEKYYSFMNDKSFVSLDMSQINDELKSMINDGQQGCALTYMKVISEYDSRYSSVYNVLSMAFDNPAEDCTYTSSEIYSIKSQDFPIVEDICKDCITASEIRALYKNDCEYDYTINNFADDILGSAVTEKYPKIAEIVNVFSDFRKQFGIGMKAVADYHNSNVTAEEAKLNEVIKKAQKYYNTYVNSREAQADLKIRIYKAIMFSEDNDLCAKLNIAAENSKEQAEEVRKFVLKFLREKSDISSENISAEKINTYIEDIWDQAGDNMRKRGKTASTVVELESRVRKHSEVVIRKIVAVMCEWLGCVDKKCNYINEMAESYFLKERENIIDALERLSSETSKTSDYSNPVLRSVFSDIYRHISGNYSSEAEKFFFIDFLTTDYITLDSNGIPDITSTFFAVPDFSIIDRIRKHINGPKLSFEDRIKEIFVKSVDKNDYGSAVLINDYLQYSNSCSSLIKDNIDTYIEYSKGQAHKLKKNFSEDLELASSKGKLHLRENLKDIMSSISAIWYKKCCENNNYGFYTKLIKAMENIIQEESLKREKLIKMKLENIKSSYSVSDEDLNEIEEMIKVQNYTVSEDYMNQITELGSISRFADETQKYLIDFWKNYESTYHKCTDSSVKLEIALAKHKNKSTKGGIELISSWLTNGSTGGIKRLETLLTKLILKKCKAEYMGKLGKDTEKYTVKISDKKSIQHLNYKHPIAVFGSLAESEGFNVLCIFGKSDTGTLLDRFHEAGNSANTIVLLDFALTQSERRILARKIKQDRSVSKVFIVVDRVVITYLAENYAENNISRMLMAVTMPFAYYQPYIPDSSNIMPAEMFTGRDAYLSDIKSPSGVNIIYGGRQLGKSALLKMARKEIDFDEKGNRAVLVDINRCGIEEAARKVSEELVLRKIIDNVSNNWDDICFAVKQRLMDENKPLIPYFLLMLDEADKFINECGKVEYKPLAALKDIQNIGENRFKFVVAGLRDIVKFDREIALGGNSIISHLKSSVIETFPRKEGRELLLTPLSYLGIYFEKSETILNILATANYFPGLIHLYCQKLIETLSYEDYAGYSSNDTPPYIVTEKHIKKVLSDSEFQSQIKSKFEITLRSDEIGEDRENGYNYYLAALIIAYLNLDKKEQSGYSTEEIIECADNNLIKKFARMNTEQMKTILDELCSLGILIKYSDKMYNFKFQSFCTMMGTKKEIEEQFLKFME